MAQFKAYPKYKDSGVEWLGEVPEHWKISNIKRSTYLKGRVGWKGLTSNEFEVNSFAYLVTGTDFKQKYINWSSCYQINESRYEDDPYIQLKNGDLLMTKDGTIGKLAIVKNLNKSACLNSGIFLIRPEKYYSTEFMYWVLNSNAFNLFFVMNTTGSTILHLYQNVFERFVFSYPNFKEQERIVSYLNLETAKIDTLIAKQEKLIELLEEQRKSVISHAVTKGLDPNAPMKDSGIEWLGEVPEHWEIKPIKSLYTRVKKTGFEQETLLSVYREYGVIIKSSRDDNHNRASDDLSPYQLVNIGDLVINKMKAWQGSLAISEYKGIVSPAYYIYTPIITDILNDKFIHNQIRSKYFVQSYKNFSKGIRVGQWDLENDLFVRINLYIPPLSEQTQIANYLDKETAKIDTLIAKQEKLIELLEEQRKSVISHAVTKGLDPNAPMKDSGIEWLGEVPEHWEIKPIKSLYTRVKKTGFEQETLLSVYREYGVIIKSSRDDNHNRASDDLSPYQLVNIGDLVINKMKAWQGSLAISEYKGIVSPAYYIYTPIITDILNDKFIHNQIRSKYFVQSYKNFSKGIRVGQWDLENDLFVRINLYIPPLSEQTQIANYLDKETAKIDILITKQKRLIEKLKEYRASVISHAVTGKIDVRELAA